MLFRSISFNNSSACAQDDAQALELLKLMGFPFAEAKEAPVKTAEALKAEAEAKAGAKAAAEARAALEAQATEAKPEVKTETK